MNHLTIFCTTIFIFSFSLSVFSQPRQDKPVRMTVFQFSGKGLDQDLVKRIEIEMGAILYDFAGKCPRSIDFIERGGQSEAIDFGKNLDEQYRNEYQIPVGPQSVPAKANLFVLVKLEANNFGVLAKMDVFDRNGTKLAGGIHPSNYAANALYEYGNRKDLMEQLIEKALKRDRMEIMVHHFDKNADVSCFGEKSGGGGSSTGTQKPISRRFGEVDFTLKGCRKVGRDVICDFEVKSNFQDRDIIIYTGYSGANAYLYDDHNNEILAKNASILGKVGSTWAKRRFIADVPAKCDLTFENISTQAKKITLLEVAVAVDGKKNKLQYRDVALQ